MERGGRGGGGGGGGRWKERGMEGGDGEGGCGGFGNRKETSGVLGKRKAKTAGVKGEGRGGLIYHSHTV